MIDSRQSTTVIAQPNVNSMNMSNVHQQFYDCLAVTYDQYQAPLPQLLIADAFNPTNDVCSPQFLHLNHPASMLSPYTPQSVSSGKCRTPGFSGSDSVRRDGSVRKVQSELTAPSSVTAEQSPRPVDFQLPGVGHSAPSEEFLLYQNQQETFYQPSSLNSPSEMNKEDVEEISRDFSYDVRLWSLRHSSPAPYNSSGSPTRSLDPHIPKQLQDSISSSEAMSRRFHQDTCGVLSVKDGPTENPWRTLVWPLARDCPALYHAIASMTSFHQSAHCPPLRIQGIDHMQIAIQALAEGLGNMRFDAAISTTLVLAFAESWDVHISTGINHIKGAKVLINQALMERGQTPKEGEEWVRLKFLCNTWIYMDVIARLTSADNDDSNDVDAIYDSIHSTERTDAALDPLMGCAHLLFPIIGRVASLIRRLRKSIGDHLNLTMQATRLKSQLEGWAPPSHIENPEDETTSPRDSIRTATAYQYATLLYLHQAFPKLPSLPALVLAKKALCELASVEPSSRTCIVHIYPLMAAGCEMVDKDDRAWVIQRWELLLSRMKLGIIDKSLTVTKEVWARRDAYAAECNSFEVMRSDSMSNARVHNRIFHAHLDSNDDDDVCWLGSRPKRRATDSDACQLHSISSLFASERRRSDGSQQDNVELLASEFTVRGRLHWLGVMRDWNWEGELPQTILKIPNTDCHSTARLRARLQKSL